MIFWKNPELVDHDACFLLLFGLLGYKVVVLVNLVGLVIRSSTVSDNGK